MFTALILPTVSFKSKRKLLIEKGGFIIPILTSILSGVIETLIITINKWRRNV